MFFAMILFGGLCVAMWSAISLVDTVVAIARNESRYSLRWQFSLRTLLVAITLAAVGLGLIVWLR